MTRGSARLCLLVKVLTKRDNKTATGSCFGAPIVFKWSGLTGPGRMVSSGEDEISLTLKLLVFHVLFSVCSTDVLLCSKNKQTRNFLQVPPTGYPVPARITYSSHFSHTTVLPLLPQRWTGQIWGRKLRKERVNLLANSLKMVA